MALGPGRPTRRTVPLESFSDDKLMEQALHERDERARSEKMMLQSAQPDKLWTDYTVTSAASGKTYRLVLRGWERGQSYCSCPDFRKNTLGTCKHILNALEKLKRRFKGAERQQPYVQETIAVQLHYGKELELRLSLPPNLNGRRMPIVAPLKIGPSPTAKTSCSEFANWKRQGFPVLIYPDAEEYVQQRLFQSRDSSQSRGHSRQPGGASAPQRTPQDGVAALSTGRDRLRRGSRARHSGRRHGSGQNDPGRGRGGATRRAKWIFARCWSFARPRSNRNGAMKFNGSRSGIASSSPAAWTTGPGNMPTTASLRSAITSRSCATSWPSSSSSGT